MTAGQTRTEPKDPLHLDDYADASRATRLLCSLRPALNPQSSCSFRWFNTGLPSRVPPPFGTVSYTARRPLRDVAPKPLRNLRPEFPYASPPRPTPERGARLILQSHGGKEADVRVPRRRLQGGVLVHGKTARAPRWNPSLPRELRLQQVRRAPAPCDPTMHQYIIMMTLHIHLGILICYFPSAGRGWMQRPRAVQVLPTTD